MPYAEDLATLPAAEVRVLKADPALMPLAYSEALLVADAVIADEAVAVEDSAKMQCAHTVPIAEATGAAVDNARSAIQVL